MSTRQFIHNEDEQRYELHVGTHVAIAEYMLNNKGIVFMTHTEVPQELGGQGVASELIKNSLTDIKERGLHVAPLCPFVKAYIEKHPEWASLVKTF